MSEMITNITGVFRMSKVGDYGDEILQGLILNELDVEIKNETGNNFTICHDLLISKVEVESDDGDSYLKNDLLEYYKHTNTQDISLIHMVILHGVRYQVFRINSTVHMVNNFNNEIEFTVPAEKFIAFLEGMDEFYSTYTRINKFL